MPEARLACDWCGYFAWCLVGNAMGVGTIRYSYMIQKILVAELDKGPDCYQEVQGVKTYFSDAEQVQGLL